MEIQLRKFDMSEINDYKFEVCTIISDLNDAYQNLVRKKESAA